MEQTNDTEKTATNEATNDHGKAESKQDLCGRRRAVRVTAALVGFLLSTAIVLSLYAAGVFDSGPVLPELLEGEGIFSSGEGDTERFHIMIDYKRNIVQLTSLDQTAFTEKAPVGRRLLSIAENRTDNGTNLNASKIVIQDYNTKRKYFIVPEKNGSHTNKCLYTSLEGDMIPRHLLKHATLLSEEVEGNFTHTSFRVDNETEADVYQAKGQNGKVYQVYLHLPNTTVYMRSKEEGLNFTDFRRLSCYRYYEENDTIEESFYASNDSKIYKKVDHSEYNMMNDSLQSLSSNFSLDLNATTDFNTQGNSSELLAHVRRRRGLGIRENRLDWWYGNWCGPYQGGYTTYPKKNCKRSCYQSTSYITSACRSCLPPRDGLDEACMEHDRCLVNDIRRNGRGPRWCQPIGNRCKCDTPFVRRAFRQIFRCPTVSCIWHALQAYKAFQLLSCWFPLRSCFPWMRVTCHCKFCLCPSIRIYRKCISFKMCFPFGSGKVSW